MSLKKRPLRCARLLAAAPFTLGFMLGFTPGFIPGALAAEQSIGYGMTGSVIVPADAIADDAPLYLRPGGPHPLFSIDLDADARDIAIVHARSAKRSSHDLSGDPSGDLIPDKLIASDLILSDLILVAAGADGLMILRLMDGAAPQLLARHALPGIVGKVVTRGQTAWLSGPGGLYAVDIRDPAQPRTLTGYAAAGGAAPIGLAVRGNRAYLLFKHELHVLDLSSGDPQLLARQAFGFEAHGLVQGDEGLYIAAGDYGLLIYDADDPSAGLRGFRSSAPVTGVALAGDRIYLVEGNDALTVLQRGESDTPRWLGSLRGVGSIAGIGVDGERALAHDRAGRLFLLDVARPQAMERSALLRPRDCCAAYLLDGERAYALAGSELIGFDLGVPPPRVSNEGLASGQGINFGGQRRVYIDEALAYVADWFSGVHIYGISNPQQPALLSSFHTGGSPKGIVVRDGLAYVPDDDGGLLILDVADPRRPQAVSRLALPGLAYTPVLDGDRLYIASHHGGVVVVDVRDPRAPVLAAHYDTPGKAWSLRVRDDIVYIADDDAGLQIVDFSDLAQPRPIARYDAGDRVEEVLLDGDFAYIALYEGGVDIVDIGDPAAPAAFARLNTTGNARGLALRDGLLYVADWLAGVQIVDVSVPAQAQIVGSHDTDGAAWGLALHESIAFVADWWGGIALLDVGDPARPRHVASYPPRARVAASATDERFVYVAQGTAGLQIFDIGNPLNPIWVTGVELDGASDVLLHRGDAWVLHDGGQRVARIDISNPYQARTSEDLELGYTARLLYPAGAAVLALGEQEYTLIDGDAGASHRHTLYAGITDADAADDIVVLADREGRILTLAPDGSTVPVSVPAPLTAPSDHAAIDRLAFDGQRLVLWTHGEGLRLLQAEGTALHEAARIPFDGRIDALHIDGDLLYIASGNRLLTLDIATPSAWRLNGVYETMEDIGGITVWYDGMVYLAGGTTLRALEIPPAVDIGSNEDGSLRLAIPAGLPPGSYDLADARALNDGAEAVRLRDALRVQPLRLGRIAR